MNLDPTEFATAGARATAVRSLLDTIDRVCGVEADADAETVRRFVTRDEFPPKPAAAVGMFVCAAEGLFEVVTLPKPVASSVVVDQGAALSPVASLVSAEQWCVLLVSRARARVLLGMPDMLNELTGIEDRVHRKHDQGGWSQARYQRSVEVDVDRHLDTVASTVKGLEGRFDRLALGCTSEVAPRALDALDAHARDRFFARFDIDVENTSVPEVAAAAEPLFALRDAERVSDALGRVAEGLAHGLAAAGPADVSRALEMRAVRTLLIEPRTDNGDGAIREAIAQGAEILPAAGTELEPYGRIAAVLRF